MNIDKKFALVLISIFFCLFSAAPLASAQESLTYENKAMGVRLTGPQGWFITSGDKVKSIVDKRIGDITQLESIKEATRKLGVLVVFTRYPFGSQMEFNPNIVLTTEPLVREYIKSPLDVANANILSIRTMLKDVKVITAPAAASLGGQEGAHFVYEGTRVIGYMQTRLKASAYVFVKDDTIYTLSFTAKEEDYNDNVTAFNSSIETFLLK